MARPPRRFKKRWAGAGGAAFLVGGAAMLLGPAAGWAIDHAADGLRVWRLGRIEIDGVSGPWVGALRARHVAIADDQGVWIEAEDVTLEWRPFEILLGGVRLDRAHAARLHVLRQPTLLEKRPSGDADFNLRLDDVSIDDIALDEPVLGEAARLTARLEMELRGGNLEALGLDLRRTDAETDRALIAYNTAEAHALSADIEGAPGGILARALGVPEQRVRAAASGDGDAQTGAARYEAAIDAAELLSGRANWTPADWRFTAAGDLTALPRLRALARRIGDSVRVHASGARVGAFQAHGETPFLSLDIHGALDEKHRLEGGARFVAATRRASDIARESPLPLGAARAEGEVRQARGVTALRATLDASGIELLGRAAHFVGPVEASLSPERFALNADLRAAGDSSNLFAQARLQAEMSYDRQRGRYELTKADLAGDALALDGQGAATRGEGVFSGRWRVRRLQTLAARMRGEAGGQWRAFSQARGDGRVWTLAASGAGARVSGEPEAAAQLLGAAPRLDARLTVENGGLTVSHARIDGARLRAGATGRIVHGQANLALEASARGPLDLGGARIAGAVDATGRLSGRIARPSVTAHAVLASFTAGAVAIERPVLDFTLAPNGRGYGGRANLQGQALGQPLTASGDVSLADGALALGGLNAQLAALRASGDASFTARGASARLALDGHLDGLAPAIAGRLNGALALTPETLTLDAQIADARAGDLRVRAASLRAHGPLDQIAVSYDMRGRLRQAPLAFAGRGALVSEGGETALSLEGRGALAGHDFFTRAPISARWADGRAEAALDVALGEGVVAAQWSERGRAVSGSANVQDAPLAPLAAIWGERAIGRVDGRVSLASAGRGLSGSADVTLRQARFAGRQEGVLDMHITGDLEPSRLRASVDAASSDGLNAHFEADAPVTTSSAPIRIALAPERRGRARWSVRGSAASLWAAARLPDQTLSGNLDGGGELQFGAGYLAGDGRVEIANGRFEDKLTGITLANLNAALTIGEGGVNLERFEAVGADGGRVTATGGSANPRQGAVDVSLRDMRVANRPDARARASGDLRLTWEGLHSTFSGDLNIIEANLDIAANPEAGIPTLDVIEINRPGEADDFDAAETPRRNGSTALNVRVRAPGRVFTRGRGVDAEWALDLRLDGTGAHPRVHGEARIVRGTLALSGQPFEISDARILFNGDPMDAQIDLSAERDTADLTAYIRLTGTARDPEIAFTSDPALPEDEILPQILFGRSVEDLSPFEAAQLAASLAALSGRASLDLVDAARAAAGLDRFNVRQDEDGGFLVAGGVYLTREVYLEVARTGLGQAQTRVEWTVRPKLVLITSFRGDGDQRLSLRWRRESN